MASFRRTGWFLHVLAAFAAGPVGVWLCAQCSAANARCLADLPRVQTATHACCTAGAGAEDAQPPRDRQCVIKANPRLLLPPPQVDLDLTLLPPLFVPAGVVAAAPVLNPIIPVPARENLPPPGMSPKLCHAPRAPPAAA